MNTIRLSICIPVFNFGAFIGDTLNSIIEQAPNDVEIVVVDGASTDNTSEVISKYQKIFPELRYYRLDKKGGIDKDMAKSVELARGEYCWLFGGDDIMMPGALSRLLSEIPSAIDLFLCESILCQLNMEPFSKHKMMNIDAERVFDLEKEEARLQYFKSALNTGAFFSFCSSLIFRKSKWDSVAIDESFMESHWAHVARIFGIMSHGLKVKYIPTPYLYKRCENDSFLDKGLVHRYQFAIEGYHRLADFYFGNSSIEAFHIRRVIRYEFPLLLFIRLKWDCYVRCALEDRAILDHLASTVYSDPSLINRFSLFVYRFTPMLALKILKLIFVSVRSLMAKTK